MKLKKTIKLLIACDGGAASGKTTAARLISRKYNLHFLSSGLLYRYISFKLLSQKKLVNKELYIKTRDLNKNQKITISILEPIGPGLEAKEFLNFLQNTMYDVLNKTSNLSSA